MRTFLSRTECCELVAQAELTQIVFEKMVFNMLFELLSDVRNP